VLSYKRENRHTHARVREEVSTHKVSGTEVVDSVLYNRMRVGERWW